MQTKKIVILYTLAIFSTAVGVSAMPAHAYFGPGAGIGVVGSVLALLGAVFLLLVGFVWYPVKRLLKGRSQKPSNATEDADN